MTNWTRITDSPLPAFKMVNVVHVPPRWNGVRFVRALVLENGELSADQFTIALGGTITHWAEDAGLDEAEQEWALEYARHQEAAK